MWEKLCYATLSAASLVAIVVLVHREIAPQPAVSRSESAHALVGKPVRLSNVRLSSRNAILAISTRCHFCGESMPFYRGLASIRTNPAHPFKLIVIAPQDAVAVREYLAANGVQVDEIAPESPSQIKIAGTPTVLISDEKGIVRAAFSGKLDSSGQEAVIKSLQ